MLPLSRPLAIALLVGTALLGVGAALHPILPPDPSAQLRLIAATWYFRPIHLAMLAGSALIIVGVWSRALLGRGSTPVPLIAALALICLGICFNAIDIAFMAGAGTQMAAMFQTGRAEMSTLFDALHMFGLMTARFGNLLIALGTLLIGWIERQDPASPRWVAWLAWIAGAGGLTGVLFFPEASLAILTAVTLLSGWTLATGVRVLRGAAEPVA
ncbi:MAG TPA: hypothetical protein VKA54_08120 [Gemmatimonadaceae bacterium]|nr:hypothetical protein [Gemmatimonadaceae bacterium]